jgi:hypothetical protein
MAAPVEEGALFKTLTFKGENDIFPNTTQLVSLPAEGDLPAVAGNQVNNVLVCYVSCQ